MSGQRQKRKFKRDCRNLTMMQQKNYIHGKSETAEDWAAYESRLAAVGRLLDGNYRSAESKYLDDSDGEVTEISSAA